MEKIYSLSDKVTFGKYKGKTVRYMIDRNPKYAKWAYTNVSWFKLTKYAADYLKDAYAYKASGVYSQHIVPEEFDSEFQFMDFFGNY